MGMGTEVDISKLIRRGGIFKNVEGSTPKEVYENVSKLMELPEDITPDFLASALCAREEVLSTAVGNGIALPHARAPIMKKEDDTIIMSREYKLITFATKRFGKYLSKALFYCPFFERR